MNEQMRRIMDMQHGISLLSEDGKKNFTEVFKRDLNCYENPMYYSTEPLYKAIMEDIKVCRTLWPDSRDEEMKALHIRVLEKLATAIEKEMESDIF